MSRMSTLLPVRQVSPSGLVFTGNPSGREGGNEPNQAASPRARAPPGKGGKRLGLRVGTKWDSSQHVLKQNFPRVFQFKHSLYDC